MEGLPSDVWDSGHAQGLLHVKRMSMRGNPHTRGMVISDKEPIPFPDDFELNRLSDDIVDQTIADSSKKSSVKEMELSIPKNNSLFSPLFLQFW